MFPNVLVLMSQYVSARIVRQCFPLGKTKFLVQTKVEFDGNLCQNQNTSKYVQRAAVQYICIHTCIYIYIALPKLVAEKRADAKRVVLITYYQVLGIIHTYIHTYIHIQPCRNLQLKHTLMLNAWCSLHTTRYQASYIYTYIHKYIQTDIHIYIYT